MGPIGTSLLLTLGINLNPWEGVSHTLPWCFASRMRVPLQLASHLVTPEETVTGVFYQHHPQRLQVSNHARSSDRQHEFSGGRLSLAVLRDLNQSPVRKYLILQVNFWLPLVQE